MFSDTAASDTSRSTAAFFTEPRRATAANARSWVGVTGATLISLNRPPCHPQATSQPSPARQDGA
jgi:hypothetical protein